jgi:pimeloyl-ACP methyl ester carboxylesterase
MGNNLHTLLSSSAGGWVIWALTRGGGAYCALILLLLVTQRSLIFPRPSHSMALNPGATGGQVLVLARSAAVYFPAREGENTLVFFHGNGDQIGGTAAHLGARLNSADGLGFLGIEYPGYTIAPGAPSEAACVDAAVEMIEHLLAAAPGGQGVPPERVVLFGQSIGCAVALHLAARGFGQRILLLSPFTSLHDVASAAFPIVRPALRLLPFLLRDTFDNRAKARALRMPALVIHGKTDEIVPFEQGKALAEDILGARFLPYKMGHNNVFSPPHGASVIAAIRSFAAAGAPHPSG